MMKQCSLCENPATVYCDSDQASLCWVCDKKVHEANFLVAKHMRSLLCHACQSPTPWRGSGLKLMPAVSVCGVCVPGWDVRAKSRVELGEGDGGRGGTDDQSDEYESDDDDEHNDDDDDGENQVVPWAASSPLHPISRSPSCDEEEPSNRYPDGEETIFVISRKRQRDHENEEGGRCSSVQSRNQLVFQLSPSKGRRREHRVDEAVQRSAF